MRGSICTLLSPYLPSETTCATIIKKVDAHPNPKPSEIAERYKFHIRVLQYGELVVTFTAELSRLTEHCNLGATIDDMIGDHFVDCINDGVVQRCLLAMEDLKLTDAISTALLFEPADRNARKIATDLTPS